MNFKLIKRNNPRNKEASRKWYATPQSSKPESIRATTRGATENTSIAPSELETSLDLFGKYALKLLLLGHTVRVGELGYLRISFTSKGTDDINEFNAGNMISNPRLIFTPSKSVRTQIRTNITYENAGVIDEGVSYSSLTDYRKAKGIATPTNNGSGSSSSGESGSGTGGNSGGSGSDDDDDMA